ncbi:MAG: hypothetical protein CMM52_06470 [Rhodospirillaceae bacterium]|nr:hypothetical protein [Rhodospirillaceae bacterium]|tara:strand:- start:2854 stop:3861 length:1008 start_codon:yes stop_codon:yes gene_type:complete
MILRTVLATGAAVAVLATGAAQAQHKMNIGMVTINDPQHAFTKHYAELINKRSGGKIQAKVFPAGQLGKIPRQLENLKIGAQAAFASPPGFLSGMNVAFQSPDAPGKYKNFWHAHNAFTTPKFRTPFLNLADKHGIIGVSIYNYGPTSIASLKPIRKLSDLKGLKVRVLATKMESKLANVLGVTGVPMPYLEVLPALQRKTIDACRSSIVVMGASKFFTTTKSITLIESGHIPSVLFVSKRWMGKLSKDLQKMVRKTGRDAEAFAGKFAYEANKKAEALWKKNGAEVIRLSAADQAEVTRRLAPLGDEFLGSNPKTKKMYNILQGVLKTASTKAP